MDFFDVLERRHSTRSFQKVNIPDKDVKRIKESILHSPSGANIQPYHFIFIDDDRLISKIGEVDYYQSSIKNLDKASVLVAALSDEKLSPNYSEVDTAIALTYIDLTATNLGYDTCWFGCYGSIEIKRLLGIPKKLKLICILAIGKEKDKKTRSIKFPLKKLISSNNYKNVSPDAKTYYIKIGNKCNNNCPDCNRKINQEKDTNEIISEILSAKQNGFDAVVFPCNLDSRKDYLYIFKKINTNIRIVLETNGRVFSSNKVLNQLNTYVDEIQLMKLGKNEGAYDIFTGTENTFNQYIKGIKNLKKHNTNVFFFKIS